METAFALPANETAERIVRHFQAEGFVGISEALVLRIALKSGAKAADRTAIERAFDQAAEENRAPPVADYFEIRPYGHFSGFREFDDARTAFQTDFSVALRRELPRVFFDAPPVVVDDALATGTKHDALLKLNANVGEQPQYAFAILLNDPDSSLFEYLGTHHGNDWSGIIGEFETTAASFDLAAELL